MHEIGVIKSLIHEVERVAMHYGGPAVLAVRVRIGVLCPFSGGFLLDHFQHHAKGTVAEHARLVMEYGTDPTDPLAQDVALLSIEVEDVLPMVVRVRAVSTK